MVRDNLFRVFEKIERVCGRSRRSKEKITLVAVTKTVSPEKIKEAIEAGIKIIGENRVQEAEEKYKVLGDIIDWHMVGHLQRNKVKRALEIFSMIQSVDSLSLAREIEKRADNEVFILIEVNTSKETTKFGISDKELFPLIEELMRLSHINIQGLMTLGPGFAIYDPESSRSCFKTLFRLREKAQKEFGLSLPVLSMGMSSDFEIGIEEGATMVRVGTAIFGPRDYH